MKIKYKLIAMFILITLIASLPVSLFILNKQEEDKIAAIAGQGKALSSILAQSVVNIILANGGDIKATQIDVKEMIAVMTSLEKDGLIYADAILVSSKEAYNGIVLAALHTSGHGGSWHRAQIEGAEVARLMSMKGYAETIAPGSGDVCYEFAATGATRGKQPLCVGRLIFSKSVVLDPTRRMNAFVYGVTAFAILSVSILGLILSRMISKPIGRLTQATRKIEVGDFSGRIEVTSRDEIGMLSHTFNHMLGMINQKISELESTNRRLTQLDILKDEFLATISHELRTPLSGIIGIAESLMRGAAGDFNEKAMHDISLVIASGRRLASLVDDILDFSRLKQKDIRLDVGPVNLHDVTQLVISILRPLIEQKALNVKNEIDPGRAIVNGDERRIQQILLNLLGNAIKFTDSGSITISAFTSEEREDPVTVTVSDTGIGIPADMRERIFESFEQVDGSITRRRGGSGLGLAITKKLVELHGGTIRVESEPGAGSRFIFTLERGEESRERRQTEAGRTDVYISAEAEGGHVRPVPGAITGKNRKHVLVVDDEPVNLQVIVNHLSLEGYDVNIAESGQELLRLLDGRPVPDLLLLDVMLPGISGYDVCRVIRKKYSMHELPIIILTAKSSALDVVTGLAAGANDYLTKPVNRDELVARVSNLIMLKEAVKAESQLKVINSELALAAEIQKSLIPPDMPHLEGLDCAVRYEPSTQVGGDYYDYHVVDENRIGFLLADVAGHGIPAAMVAAMLKVAYTFYKQDLTDPSRLFQRMNAVMEQYQHGLFATACCVYIDLKKMKLYHSSAGHWPLIISRWKDRQIVADVLYNRPIGLMPGSTYIMNEIDIHEQDRIVMYTDGIFEVRNREKKVFGIERFQSLIAEYRPLAPADCIDRLVKDAKQWAGVTEKEILADDITLLVLDITCRHKGS